MKRILILVAVLAVTLAVSAYGARVQSTMITHLNQVYQVCSAVSEDCLVWSGYAGTKPGAITAAPGVLAINPGANWKNFIGAYWANPPLPRGCTVQIKNVTLVKKCPTFIQCNEYFPSRTITQQGTPNIRLWWPLMYETPSCTFTLTILYGTSCLWDDDGSGPNPPAWVHVEQWVWHVDTDLNHLLLLLELFHELPFGLDEVPLISDEVLFAELREKILLAIRQYAAGDMAGAAATLADFELEVMDACITVSPRFPNPTGPGTGIANTTIENPACCKLLVDVEYIGQTTGIFQPKK
ncbi:MAG: hypothetical protein N3B12_06315 [Armatimonadetes bacterium]|nr:hypothetical protein [Armatimonadota bacterium]